MEFHGLARKGFLGVVHGIRYLSDNGLRMTAACGKGFHIRELYGGDRNEIECGRCRDEYHLPRKERSHR